MASALLRYQFKILELDPGVDQAIIKWKIHLLGLALFTPQTTSWP